MILDTNLVSAYLKQGAAEDGRRVFVARCLADGSACISMVTKYELERGFQKVLYGGDDQAKRGAMKRLIELKKFLESLPVFGLDGRMGEGWDIAARLWAAGRACKPSVVFEEADLLIAATAALHGKTLATAETKPAMRLLPELASRARTTLRVEFVTA
ncbi:MAG: PIN domain-containing protein [Sandaracinaceae bacterium]|nr:PIN domain-containing protein [Sandaracinaceae bacterium]